MSASKHLGVRDAVAALFAAGTPLAGGRIHENRDLTLPESVASAISVYRVQSVPTRELVGPAAPIDWITDVRVVVKGRKSGATTAETLVDDLACNVYARVMADQTLGGLAAQLEPGALVWDQDEADTAVAACAWDLRVWHRTQFNAITS